MKYVFLCFAIVFLCSAQFPKGYISYQTFDEYTLDGVTFSSEGQKAPYVLVKKEKDSIFIMFSYQRHSVPIKYINRGNYWYNIRIEDNYCEPGFKCEIPFNRCLEKYIYNDTILSYGYYKDFITNTELTLGRDITIETKKAKIRLAFGNSVYIDSKNKFESIKSIADNYISNFPYPAKEYQPKWYRSFYKEIRQDTLFIYENDSTGNYKNSCLYDIRKLNSLGEFDLQKGESIIYELDNLINQCK